MVLHLAHHKSYHPYKAENVERVRRDEELARLAEEKDANQTLAVDAEARLESLRKKAASEKKRKRNAKDVGEVELENQLQGKKHKEEESRVSIVRPEAEASQELDGHINFWADMEKGVTPANSSLPGNADYLAEKAAQQAKLEKQIGVAPMYLVCAPSGSKTKANNADLNPWYSTKDLRSTKERKKTQDQILEDTFKDGELKRSADPMSLMNGYLKKRSDIQAAQERVRERPWDVTPMILRKDEDVAVPMLRDRRKGKQVQREEEQEDDYGPMKPPPPPKQEDDAQTAATNRVKTERSRAQALRAEAARKKALASPASTPRSEFSAGYFEGFNKQETRDAHRRRDGDRWQSQRWDEQSHSSRRHSDNGKQRYYH